MNAVYKMVIGSVLVAIAGCVSETIRENSIDMVYDAGLEVSTRHKYHVACAYEGESSETIDFDGNVFENFQSKVFSRDGIPISLRVRLIGVERGLYKHQCRFDFDRDVDGIESFVVESGSYNSHHIVQSASTQRVLAYGIAVKLKNLEDSGKIDVMLNRRMSDVSKVSKHNIIRLERDSNKNFSYFFEIELLETSEDVKNAFRNVLQEFAKSLKEDYIDTFPSADSASLEVSFSGFKRDGLRLSGSAAVLTLKPISLEYNSHNRIGTMSVRFVEGQSSEASAWIRRNIKTLVRDKNVALTNGSRPSEGKFIIINESISGNVMTIEFKAE